MLKDIAFYKKKLSTYLEDRDVMSLSSLLDDINISIEGESADIHQKIIADISKIINEYAKTLYIQTDPRFQILGFSGEGGKGMCTYNISTISCILAALLYDEVKIVKSGSKKNTSSCGSFDFLNYLGIHSKPDKVNMSLSKHNIAFFETAELYRFLPIFFMQKNTLCQEIFKKTIFNEVRYTYKIIGLNSCDFDTYIHKYSESGIKELCLISSFHKDYATFIDELFYGLDTTIISYIYTEKNIKLKHFDLKGQPGISLQQYVLIDDTFEQRKRFLEAIIHKNIDMENIFMKTIILNVAMILSIYNHKPLMENFDAVQIKYLESKNIQKKWKLLLNFYRS